MSSYRHVLRTVPADRWKQWDAFVNESHYGHFLQSWGWGELKAGGEWRPLRLALWDEEQGQIAAVAQILCRTAAHLPLRAGHLAYIPKGPVIDWSHPSLCQAFFAQLNAYLRRQGTIALRMEPQLEVEVAVNNCLMEGIAPLPLYPVSPVQPLRSILLDLALDEETLLTQMKEKWRYNLRLAARKGVRVRAARTIEDVRTWYALLQTTSERDRFGIHTLDYYLRAWQIFAPRHQGCLFLAEYDEQLLAGIFVGLLAKEAIYLYGASSNEHRGLMPNYLLQWEAIRWARQQGATRYDFWGIPETDSEDEAMAGVYRFKRGWGGRVVRFAGCYEHIYRPREMKLASYLYNRNRKL